MAIVTDDATIVFVVGPPRSGTTLFYELISNNFDVASQVQESHDIWEGPFHPKQWNYSSQKIPEGLELDTKEKERIFRLLKRRSFVRTKSGLYTQYKRYSGNRILRKIILTLMRWEAGMGSVNSNVIVEKTPRNCLRLKALESSFPNAKFAFIIDDIEKNIRKVEKAWNSKTPPLESALFGERFGRASYKESNVEILKKWKFVLPDGWEKADGNTLEIARMQVSQCINELTTFYKGNRDKCILVTLNELVSDPHNVATRLGSKFGLRLTNESIELSQINRLGKQ